jgi:GDP-D-mannose dehydratase
MKKLATVAISSLFAISAYASSNEVEKKGFLTTKWCAEQGMYKDCRTESILCGSGDCFKTWEFGDKVTTEIVLFSHDENKIYNIDTSKSHNIHMGEVLETAINMNEVTMIGELKGNTIYAHDFKAPPPPKKSFFKGCL